LIDFQKILKFHDNPLSGSRVVLCRRTDGQIYMHDEANCRLSQLCNVPITKLLTDFLKFDLCEVV